MCGITGAFQPGHRPRPLSAARRLNPKFDAAGEQDLHADADPEHRAAGGHPLGDDPLPRDLAQAGHTRFEGADAGYHQPVGGRCRTRVGGDFHRGADPLQRTLSRP